jgi:hypothetical protein
MNTKRSSRSKLKTLRRKMKRDKMRMMKKMGRISMATKSYPKIS